MLGTGSYLGVRDENHSVEKQFQRNCFFEMASNNEIKNCATPVQYSMKEMKNSPHLLYMH